MTDLTAKDHPNRNSTSILLKHPDLNEHPDFLDHETKKFIANQEGRGPELARFTSAFVQTAIVASQMDDPNEDAVLTEGTVIGSLAGLALSAPLFWIYKKIFLWRRKKEFEKLRAKDPNAKLSSESTPLNPTYRALKTIMIAAVAVGTFVSYFIPIKAAQKVIVAILAPAFGFIAGIIGLVVLLLFPPKKNYTEKNTEKQKDEEKNHFKTNHEGWSKYSKTGLVYGTSLGCLIGGILALTTGGLFSSIGAAIAISGAAGAVIGFIAASVLVPLINWLSSRNKPATKEAGLKDPLDKNKFRNNYPRVGITVFAALFAVIGFMVGTMLFPGLGAMAGMSLGAALGGVIGGPVFTAFGPKISKYIEENWLIDWNAKEKKKIRIISSFPTEIKPKTYFICSEGIFWVSDKKIQNTVDRPYPTTIISRETLQTATEYEVESVNDLTKKDGYKKSLLLLAKFAKISLKPDELKKLNHELENINKKYEKLMLNKKAEEIKQLELQKNIAQQSVYLTQLPSKTDELQKTAKNQPNPTLEKLKWITRITDHNDTNNSWDYAMRSTAYVFAFLGTLIGLLAFSVPGGSTFIGVNFVGAILGGAIGSLVGAILGLGAIKVARSCQERESKSSLIPWSQRICIGATKGSIVGAAVGFFFGLLLGGPAMGVIGAAIGGSALGFAGGCWSAFSDKSARNIWEKLWRKLTGQSEPKPFSKEAPISSSPRISPVNSGSSSAVISRSPSPSRHQQKDVNNLTEITEREGKWVSPPELLLTLPPSKSGVTFFPTITPIDTPTANANASHQPASP